MKRSLPASLAILFIAASDAGAGDFAFRLAGGLTGPAQRVQQGERYDIRWQFDLGKSPVLAAGFVHRWRRHAQGVLDVSFAPRHPYQRWSCNTRRVCEFTPWSDSKPAKTLKTAAALEGRLPLGDVTPFVGVDAGGILYAWENRKDIRSLWSVRAGVVMRIAGQDIVAAARRSTVPNPPFGYDAYHPWEVTLGIEAGL